MNYENDVSFEFDSNKLQIRTKKEFKNYNLTYMHDSSLKMIGVDSLILKIEFEFEIITWFLKIRSFLIIEEKHIEYCSALIKDFNSAIISGASGHVFGFISLNEDEMNEIIKANHGH